MELGLTYKAFVTDIYVASGTNKHYIPFADYSGFIKNDNEIALFNYNDLMIYLGNYQKIKIYGLAKEEYSEFKELNIKHNRTNVNVTVLKFDESFFGLNGKQFDKIRRYRNYYNKMSNLEICDGLHSIDDLHYFLKEWKELRKNAHFKLFTGYDKNFFNKYLKFFSERIYCKCFYINDKLAGYVILEKVTDQLYNLIHRKVITTYQNLCLYVDYFIFNTVFNEIQKPFYVNMGSDIGESGMNNYKSTTFKVPTIIFNLIDVKILEGVKNDPN